MPECEACGKTTRHATRNGQCADCASVEIHKRRLLFMEWIEAGESNKEIAERMGWDVRRVANELSRMRHLGFDIPERFTGRIPNKVLREAFLRSDMAANELASIIGWHQLHGDEIRPDATKVLILLGLKTSWSIKKGKRSPSTRKTISESDALALGRGLNLDPHEIGC